jgi:DNA-binding transcriptional ArsR family regulator
MPQRASKGRIELKPTQERVLAALAEEGSVRLTRGRYEEIAGVSRSQAAYDLAELVDAGILERVGGGRATTYRLVRRDRPPGQRHWTNERIHAALEDFCAGRKTWPSASEFKAHGRSDLYVAASRYGGIGAWAIQLGFPQPSRATPPQPLLRSWRPRLRWAGGGAAFAAALFAAAGAAVYLERGAPAHDAAAPKRALNPASARQSAPARSEANVRSRKVAPKTAPARQVRQHARASSPSAGSRSATYSGQAELAVATSTPTHSSVSTPRQEAAQPTTGTGSAGPAPLPPPSGAGSPPAPLPPPAR